MKWKKNVSIPHQITGLDGLSRNEGFLSLNIELNFFLMLNHFLVISFIYFVHHYYSDSKWLTYYFISSWDPLLFVTKRLRLPLISQRERRFANWPLDLRNFFFPIMDNLFCGKEMFFRSVGFKPQTSRLPSQCWTTRPRRPRI